MLEIQGQKKLLNKLEKYNLDTFPHSSVFQGERGSGKHLIINWFSKEILNLPLIDITRIISYETIDNIYRNPNPTVYLINVDDLVEKDQNCLLKFIEEPLKTIFVIILCENANTLLQTVLNRCVLFELENYKDSELISFIPKGIDNQELVLKSVRTPGKLKEINLSNINDLFDLCEKIATKISCAGYANTLSIASKINYKDNYDKFDIDLFFDILSLKLKDKYIKENNPNYLDMYLLTIDYRKRLRDKRLNKEVFMQNYLTNLWKMCKSKNNL